jgi:hypothetical protein
MKMRSIIGFCAWALLLAVPLALSGQENQGYVAAVSNGRGAVKLLWPVPDEAWPASGYTLERVTVPGGKSVVIATGLRPAVDQNLMGTLPQKQQVVLRKLDTLDRQAAGGKPPEDYEGLKSFMFLNAVRDFNFARALGIAWEDHVGGNEVYVYRLKDPSGKVVGVSMPVHPGAATAPAAPPENLRAEATPSGVKLDWGDPKPTPGLPAVFFIVLRDEGAGYVQITKGPILPGDEEARKKRGQPRYVDEKPPVESKVSYEVRALDVFGREGLPSAPVEVFVPDFAAGFPPSDLQAQPRSGSVVLTWKPTVNPRTQGYYIERSPFREGPYVRLSEKPLSPSASRFEDRKTGAGARYYYRITALGPRSEAGPPSPPVMVVASGAGAPGPPTELKAVFGANRILLAWRPPVGDVAGYRVERTGGGKESWSPVTPGITPEPRYEDPVVTGQYGTVRYRVIALAPDNSESPPSKVLAVELPSTQPPPAPRITAFDGGGGKVRLDFIPGAPASVVEGFYVLRSATEAAEPEVLNQDPLPANARSYTDETAAAGQVLVYRIVSVDGAGNRSDPSNDVAVRVGETHLEAPPAPRAVWSGTPFPRVVVTFEPPPGFNLTVIERKDSGTGRWVHAAGPLAPGMTRGADNHPPRSGKVSYRVYYQTPLGTPGPPSKEVVVEPGS